ncbi:MAG: outer membrane protein assembly factor BamD [Saprospiraceae bacterium]|nr:outer membrane protein assembly factor BamD [Saprospiraceae bacterium]
MKYFNIFIILWVVLLSSCKSEFEALRTSNNPEKIYKEANKYYDNKEYDKAISLYDIVIQFYRGRQEAEDLFFRYAYAHYYTGDFILASTYFKNYSGTFSNSGNKEESEYMAAYSNFRLSPNYKLDQTNTIKAIEGFEQFINQYPDTERAQLANSMIDQLRAKLEQKSFEQGNLYFKIGQYQAAMTSFQNTLKDFPESKRLEEVRFLILKSGYILAENSVYEKQQERFEETILHYNQFVKKHPESRFSKEAMNLFNDAQKQLKKFKA